MTFDQQIKAQLTPYYCGKGYRPDPHDDHRLPRVYHTVERAIAAGVESATIEAYCPDPWDQGVTGRCVGFGTAGALVCSHAAAGTPLKDKPSPTLIYKEARAIERGGAPRPLTDDGARPTDAVEALHEFGWSPWDPKIDGPDATPAEVNAEPTLLELERASERLELDVARLSATGQALISQIMACLALKVPVGFGAFVDTAYMRGEAPESGPDFTDPNGGGHWQFLCGFRGYGREFRVQNSWGRKWADNGRIWVPVGWLLSTISDPTSYEVSK